MKLANIVILVLCASLIAGCGGAVVKGGGFTPEELQKEAGALRYARICDVSGCYLAWNVVDSDHDGVCDADELMAGTNPFDPESKPGLELVAELAGKQQLPSFEFGLGSFFIFPPELQVMLAKNQDDPLSAFPLLTDKREDALTRLGISAELLKQHGIEIERDGFTLAFGLSTDSGKPEKRIGGIELRLISAEDDPDPIPNLPHGGIKKDETLDGDHFVTYGDGTVRVDWSDGGGMSMDKNGNVLARWYVNPDADQGTGSAPTPEQEEAFFRYVGAAILTVENWSNPELTDLEPGDPRATIILVDPEYAYEPAMVFDAPRVTGAQPEGHPDLPQPGVAANPDDFAGSCLVGCP